VLVAIILAILFPGMGVAQLYNGQFGKAGMVFSTQLVLGVFLWASFLGGWSSSDGMETVANVWLILLCVEAFAEIFLFFDAVSVAVKIARGEPVGEWQWF
jgi:hypothetical protein